MEAFRLQHPRDSMREPTEQQHKLQFISAHLCDSLTHAGLQNVSPESKCLHTWREWRRAVIKSGHISCFCGHWLKQHPIPLLSPLGGPSCLPPPLAFLNPRLLLPASASPESYSKLEDYRKRGWGPWAPHGSILGLALLSTQARRQEAGGGSIKLEWAPLSATKRLQLDLLHHPLGRR